MFDENHSLNWLTLNKYRTQWNTKVFVYLNINTLFLCWGKQNVLRLFAKLISTRQDIKRNPTQNLSIYLSINISVFVKYSLFVIFINARIDIKQKWKNTCLSEYKFIRFCLRKIIQEIPWHWIYIAHNETEKYSA